MKRNFQQFFNFIFFSDKLADMFCNNLKESDEMRKKMKNGMFLKKYKAFIA